MISPFRELIVAFIYLCLHSIYTRETAVLCVVKQ